MTAVQTWTDVAPSAMNSAASFQVLMPPMPEMGKLNSRCRASWPTMLRAIGLTAGPQ
ncbi:hypothetical protein D3C72_1968830 [compost metagenome]